MTDELMEQRIAELNAHRTENTSVFNSEKQHRFFSIFL